MKTKLFLIVALLLAAFCVAKWNGPKPKFILPANFKQVLDEVADVDVWIGSLTPDPLGETLAFSSGTKAGRRLVLVDLKTLKKTAGSNDERSFLHLRLVAGWPVSGVRPSSATAGKAPSKDASIL